MSTPTPAHPATPSKAKKKSKDQDKDKDRETKEKAQLPGERLKVVVRRLPPNLPEDIFWQSVSNWVTEESVSWKAYYPGKPRKRANKENVPSRAYIAFKTPDHLLLFGREYDGHKFVDKAGNESYAVVEYAPYQKVPGEKKKPDSRHATIKKDEDYISFIESLKAPSTTEPVSIETLIASTRPPSPPKTTPLLEALKVEKQAQKDKEAIIRNHAHYKDLLKGSSAKEEKRKAARAAEAAAAVGKKGKKGGVPLPPKPVQIQAKPSAANVPAQKGNAPPASSAKPQPSSARPGRKHGAKASKEANPALPNAAATPAAAPKDAVRAPTPTAAPAPPKPAAPAQPPAQDTTPAPAAPAPARRGRPVLGLGSRHFEAALSGVGVTGDRKRREKGKEAVPANLATPRENASQEKPNPPTSPKRSRHQKGNPASAATGPDANGASVLAVPAVAQVEGGAPPPHVNGGRGGKRGGRGGRGRGGPPRVG